MNEKEILDGMSEIYMYNCSRCGQGNLSRDEVHATKSGYICLRCLEKDCLTETLGSVSNVVDK
jgi:predicted SprT family Zn-dependent metalloprotease